MSPTFTTHLNYSANHAHRQEQQRRAAETRRIRIARKLRVR
jgi:hypothetical protein